METAAVETVAAAEEALRPYPSKTLLRSLKGDLKGIARIRPYQVETVAAETAAVAEEALRPYSSKTLLRSL